jgi:plastocyanin
MRTLRWKWRGLALPIGLVFALVAIAGCRDAPDAASPTAPRPASDNAKSGQGGTGTASAVVHFGDHEAGSPFPPAVHDASFHAKDKIVPRTVTIDRGGEVRFEIGPEHQVAIFEPGTTPGDIDATETVEDPALPGPLERIVYDQGRVALSPGPSGSRITWTTPSGTFDAPGRYLMICTTNLHFLEADMYGWIEVK